MARISSRTLAKVRAQVSGMLTEACTLQREAGTTGTMGEPLHLWETVQSGIACRVIVARRGDVGTAVVGGAEAMVERYRLITPVGTPFKTDDRVVMSDGRVFEIVTVEDGLTDEAFAGAIMVRVRG